MADVKPGWTTSEFWVTAITSIVATINMFWPFGIADETLNTVASLAAILGTAAFYIWSRTQAKAS